MSHALNGNGNGHTASANTAPPPKPQNSIGKEGYVTFKTSDAVELRGVLTHMTRHSTTFELYTPKTILSTSEILHSFSIHFQGNVLYSGQAVIRNLMDVGAKMVCEVMLNETHWPKHIPHAVTGSAGRVPGMFKEFLGEWQKFCKVSPEFKTIVADMQTFLQDLQLWLDQFELETRALPVSERTQTEHDLMEKIGKLFVPAFDVLHERLEAISAQISPDLRPAHRVFIQRQLHPLMLCSPFGHRAYSKPLGYAGDYEMVNMIALDPYQGPTLFAKMVNLWFLSQWPSKAHRNRLTYLKKLLEAETLRVRHQHKPARIFNFACGPALELQRFLADFEFSEAAELTLADFNQETLNHLEKLTSAIKAKKGVRTAVHFQRMNVHQLIKENARRSGNKPKYDVVYCAGLFDYLPDGTCSRMMEIFYDWLAPGGLLAVTNVVDDKPFRHMLEFVLDWHLIYRDVEDSRLIFPDSIPREARSVKKDPTGVNIFLEARKPCE